MKTMLPSPSLPPLLQPWAAQLFLFPPELALALGDLLLRLQPLVGPISRRAPQAMAEPAGAGDIVRRGSYDRLLLSEWAIADAAPDEFLRRAAQGELLFTGPEPARSVASQRSVALFDAGPGQLGAPRLAHLALFVLLARRAELAGAAFQWGVLQQPGVLHADVDRRAVQRLLDARTWDAPPDTGLARWNEVLDAAVTDCWLIGGPGAARPARTHAVAIVRQSWSADTLDVVLVQRGRSADVCLALPEARTAARLLRRPFEADQPGPEAVPSDIISLKRAPLFGVARDRVGVCLLGGGVTLFHVPESPTAQPGRPRKRGKIRHFDSIVAAGVFRKAFASVAVCDNKLHFSGFPGPFFGNRSVALPPHEQFHMVPGTVRWGAAFYQMARAGTQIRERVLLLDRDRRLLAWSVTGRSDTRKIASSDFIRIAEGVVGAVQHEERVLFAVRVGERIDAYALSAEGTVKEHLCPVMCGGDRFEFGETNEWRGGGHLYALRLERDRWMVGLRSGASEVQPGPGDIVLGCGRLERKEAPGLIVLNGARTRIELVTDASRKLLVQSTDRIVQASFDPEHQRVAWLQEKSGVLTVWRLGDVKPLLRTLPRGGPDGT